MITIILYGVLGGALSFIGLSVLEKPLEFFLILGLVIAISLSSKNDL